MRVDVVLYKADSWDSIATYGAVGDTWRDCADDINYWLRIEVTPYWKPDDIRLAACAGTDPFAAAAIYGVARAWGIIDNAAHDWLPPFPVVVEDAQR
jgi:hypothetical protein